MERMTLTAKEAANFLGLSYWLILEMCKRKKLPHVKAGSRVLFRRETLVLWLENQEKLSIQNSRACATSLQGAIK